MLLSIISHITAPGGERNGGSYLWFSISISPRCTPSPQWPSWPPAHWPGPSKARPLSQRPPDASSCCTKVNPGAPPCCLVAITHRLTLLPSTTWAIPYMPRDLSPHWCHFPGNFFVDTHYKLIDLNIADVLQFTAVTISIDSQMEAPAGGFLTLFLAQAS